ncbi:branched-chain amino acid ABC transporter permease [Chloroflexota bacterium]
MKTRTVGLVLLAIVLVMVPFFIGRYYIDVLSTLLFNVIIVVSFRLIATTGGWSLAHIPIMGWGAYTTALMAKTLGWPFWLTLPLAALAAALVGLMISYPLARTKGFGFFIASFAAGESMRLLWTRLQVPFGGHGGIVYIPDPGSISLFGLGIIDFGLAIPYYFLTLVITAFCVLIMYGVERSRIGDDFKAIKSQSGLSRSMGINIIRYKMLAFVIGCFFAGVAGVLFAQRYCSVDPASFGFLKTMYLLVWLVFGGTSTFAGPIVGLSVMTAVHELLSPLSEWRPVAYGSILIVTLLFLPDGLESLPKRLLPWVRKVRGVAPR